MEPLRQIGKTLVVFGLVAAAVGALLLLFPTLPGRLGRLPGDIIVKRDNITFYFPVVTGLLLSLVLFVLLWLFAR